MNEPDCTGAIEEILGFCNTIVRRVNEYSITRESLCTNPDHADLVLMPLCQIGECVQRAREALEETYPEMPWHKMAGLRNVIVHGYTKVDAGMIYATVEQSIPELLAFCEKHSG